MVGEIAPSGFEGAGGKKAQRVGRCGLGKALEGLRIGNEAPAGSGNTCRKRLGKH